MLGLGTVPWLLRGHPCPFSVPRGFLERRGYWLGDPRRVRLLTPHPGWPCVWLALWTSWDHAGWHLSQPPEPWGQFHRGQLGGRAPRSSCSRAPRARCLRRAGAGLAAPSHVLAGVGDPASSFLMSSISTENMNVFGRGPDTGDTIVLASAPVSGARPAWPLSRLPGVAKQPFGSLNPTSFLAWEMDLGSAWPGLPSPPHSGYFCQSSPRS